MARFFNLKDDDILAALVHNEVHSVQKTPRCDANSPRSSSSPRGVRSPCRAHLSDISTESDTDEDATPFDDMAVVVPGEHAEMMGGWLQMARLRLQARKQAKDTLGLLLFVAQAAQAAQPRRTGAARSETGR